MGCESVFVFYRVWRGVGCEREAFEKWVVSLKKCLDLAKRVGVVFLIFLKVLVLVKRASTFKSVITKSKSRCGSKNSR